MTQYTINNRTYEVVSVENAENAPNFGKLYTSVEVLRGVRGSHLYKWNMVGGGWFATNLRMDTVARGM